jgi:hypothetical protein
VIIFVLDTRDTCLKSEPNLDDENLKFVVYSDIYCDGDVKNRISMTGCIICLLGVLICWRSKVRKRVTLSNSEAEYVAMLEAVKDICFIF